MIIPKAPETAEEYHQLVAWYAGLVDVAFSEVEKDSGVLEQVCRVPHLISAVNVLGYLRGQHSLFMESRPDGITYQKELYALEDASEKRLTDLISKLQSEGQQELLTEALTQYYLTFRLPTDASN